MAWPNEQLTQEPIPDYLKDTASRLANLGYEVNFRKLAPNHNKGRKSSREILSADRTDFMLVRVTMWWSVERGPQIRMEGSFRDVERDQVKLFEIEEVKDFWIFAEGEGQCPCADPGMSESTAIRIVNRQAEQGLKVRKQPCPIWRTVFHVSPVEPEAGH